jgi:hypothetical protein
MADRPSSEELVRLEEMFATNPEFIDRATHLVLVMRSRQQATIPCVT